MEINEKTLTEPPAEKTLTDPIPNTFDTILIR